MEVQKDIKSLLLRQQWEASFYQIVEQYSDRLYHCAKGILGNHDDANDALQEAYINIWKNLHKFKGDSAVFSWCYSIVRNQCLTALRKDAKRKHVSTEDQHHLTQTAPLRWDGDEIEAQLEQALASLPEKQRLVFELRYYQDMPYEAMAGLTETSVGALKASYHHAKEKIGHQLTQALNLP
jgi:RNA polymerase sigma-70 factor (ECF subfamily)